jgi:ketosteroid isomerase-like protein
VCSDKDGQENVGPLTEAISPNSLRCRRVVGTEYSRAVSSNIEFLRRAYEVYANDDLDGLLPLLDEQIEWRNPEDSPTAGVWHGHQGVWDWFAEFRESFDDMRFIPYEFQELPDGRVLVLLRATATAKQSGVAVDVPFAHLITIRDGASRQRAPSIARSRR